MANPADTTPPITSAAPTGGTYSSAQNVTLTCSDTGSGCDRIYYTTDGSTPTTSSPVYSGPISMSITTTLKFFAKDIAGNQESVKTQTYTIGRTITLPPSITLTFSSVTSEGTASATEVSNPSPPSNFRIVSGGSYDINFTGTFTGSVTVCINYNDSDVSGNENNLKLMHRGSTGWADITTSHNTSANIICGETTSFSEFGVFEPTSPTPVGYDSKWLIATIISLILVGGYLLRRKRSSL